MASRPFATINVALETDDEPPDLIGGNVKVSTSLFLLLSNGKYLFPSVVRLVRREAPPTAKEHLFVA